MLEIMKNLVYREISEKVAQSCSQYMNMRMDDDIITSIECDIDMIFSNYTHIDEVRKFYERSAICVIKDFVSRSLFVWVIDPENVKGTVWINRVTGHPWVVESFDAKHKIFKIHPQDTLDMVNVEASFLYNEFERGEVQPIATS